ncbi:hypothetical protein AQUCO_12200014v1 [Aquilegia coerulea]|uniref:Uncharacterized protein n=1 Tax=Aquilegia coerulea TaxID=218851 RepID=A0A2G5C1T2_AQUCA|nr:hypothetical protein AQUCO_12200014v1 [Aquilegia coerulea]
MESHQYSAYGYGFGYWNEYGITTEPEKPASTESTSYHVFPQDQNKLHSISFKEMRTGITDDRDYASMPWEDYYYTFRDDNSTKAIGEDSEIHIALEFLENLYLESHDLFKKVAAELKEKYTTRKKYGKQGHEEEEDGDVKVHLSKYLKKVPMRLHKKKLNELKVETMRRSLSLGSPRTPPKSGEESTLKLQRFKVKTLDLGGGGVQQDGQGHGGTQFQY